MDHGAKSLTTSMPFRPQSDAYRIGFFLVPDFSMIAFTAALEALRLCNHCASRQVFEWSILSPDGEPVRASNGLSISVDGTYRSMSKASAAIVCAGVNVREHEHRELIANLRRLSSFGASLGALCTGTYVLAQAGLLNGYRCTIHWENYPSMVADFPDLEISQELFEIDRNRFTCAGGTAAVDMMLSIVSRTCGAEIAAEITDLMVHHRIREAGERQRMDLRSRLGVSHPKLLAVVKRMEETIETPLSCVELANQAGVSTRQLERLFAKYLGHSPTRHYLSIRLERARFLLLQTSMPILSVAMACGFVSASHFSKSYSEYFGYTPSAERRGQSARQDTTALKQNRRMTRADKLATQES